MNKNNKYFNSNLKIIFQWFLTSINVSIRSFRNTN